MSYTEEEQKNKQRFKMLEGYIVRDSFAPAILNNAANILSEAEHNVHIEMQNAKTDLTTMLETFGEHVKGRFADQVVEEIALIGEELQKH